MFMSPVTQGFLAGDFGVVISHDDWLVDHSGLRSGKGNSPTSLISQVGDLYQETSHGYSKQNRDTGSWAKHSASNCSRSGLTTQLPPSHVVAAVSSLKPRAKPIAVPVQVCSSPNQPWDSHDESLPTSQTAHGFWTMRMHPETWISCHRVSNMNFFRCKCMCMPVHMRICMSTYMPTCLHLKYAFQYECHFSQNLVNIKAHHVHVHRAWGHICSKGLLKAKPKQQENPRASQV